MGTEVRHLEDPLGSQQRHSSTPLSKAPWREPQITAAPILWLPGAGTTDLSLSFCPGEAGLPGCCTSQPGGQHPHTHALQRQA